MLSRRPFSKLLVKIIVLSTVVVFFFIFSVDYLSKQHMQLSQNQKILQLKQLVQIARNSIEPFIIDYRNKKINREKTLSRVRNLVRNMTYSEYGQKNYIFMSSYQGIMLIQPFEPQKELSNQWDLQDVNGKYIIRELVRMAKKSKSGGYVPYYYPPPEKKTPELKISYVVGIPELQVFIGTGQYMGGIQKAQLAFRWKILVAELIFLLLLFILIFFMMHKIRSQNKVLQQEIQDKKLSENQLKLSEGRLRILIQTIPDLVWLKNKEGIYLLCNSKFERFFGAKENEIVGKTDYDFVDKKLADFFRENDVLAMKAGKPSVNEEEVVYADDGHHELLETVKTPMYNKDGQLVGVLGVARDITLRKQIERKRKYIDRINRLLMIPMHFEATIEKMLKIILDIFQVDAIQLIYPCDPQEKSCNVFKEATSTPGNIFISDEKSQFLVNKEDAGIFQEVLKIGGPVVLNQISEQPLSVNQERSDSLENQILMPLIPKEGKPWLLNMHRANLDKKWDELDKDLLHEIGSRFSNALTSLLLYQKLTESNNYIHSIIDSMPSMLIGVNSDGKVSQWNQASVNKTGITEETAIGMELEKVLTQFKFNWNELLRKIKQGESVQLKKQKLSFKDDTQYYNIIIYPLIDNLFGGAVIRIDDITENIKMEEMIVQSEKMLSVGGLAAGMAHEINNPLAAMIQSASVISNRLGSKINVPANLKAAEEAGTSIEAIRKFMEQRGIIRMLQAIKESGSRIAAIVRNMLNFSRKEGGKKAYSITVLMDETLDLALTDYDLKKNYDFKQIKISKEYEPNLPALYCEHQKLQQVFLNILQNGAQAMHESKTLYPEFIIRLSSKNGSILVEIEDNGPGMEESVRKRIFEPFFTTKPVGDGTGLGLSVSYFIITENHNGSMKVESTSGKGTKFIIQLPLEM